MEFIDFLDSFLIYPSMDFRSLHPLISFQIAPLFPLWNLNEMFIFIICSLTYSLI